MEEALLLPLDPDKKDQDKQEARPAHEGVEGSHLTESACGMEGKGVDTVTNVPVVASSTTLIYLPDLCDIVSYPRAEHHRGARLYACWQYRARGRDCQAAFFGYKVIYSPSYDPYPWTWANEQRSVLLAPCMCVSTVATDIDPYAVISMHFVLSKPRHSAAGGLVVLALGSLHREGFG